MPTTIFQKPSKYAGLRVLYVLACWLPFLQEGTVKNITEDDVEAEENPRPFSYSIHIWNLSKNLFLSPAYPSMFLFFLLSTCFA